MENDSDTRKATSGFIRSFFLENGSQVVHVYPFILNSETFIFVIGCLKLLDTLPETVYRVCELLTVVTQRNGPEWQNMVLTSLVKEVRGLQYTDMNRMWIIDMGIRHGF